MNQKKSLKLLIPILSVTIGMLFGALIMLLFGYDPIQGYRALVDGAIGSPFNIGQTIRAATPLIFTGLGFSIAYTAGFFNIGLAGQALWGWLISVWIGISFPDAPKVILLPCAIILGSLAGALWAAIAGVLKAFFNTSEVIVTIMLNYVAVYITDYTIRNIITDRMDATPYIGPNASLKIQSLTDLTKGSTIHGGIFLALIFALLVYILLNYTTLGFELKTVGMNRFAATYAGMDAKRNNIIAMFLSGALAGLGGVMNGLGEFRNIFLTNGVAPAIGFDGMAVALLGVLNPIGIVFSSLLFGGLKTGGTSMPLMAQIPSEIVDIVIASIIFFVGANYVITYFFEKKQSVPRGTASKTSQNGGEAHD